MRIEGGAWAFLASVNLVRDKITLSRETPIKVSSFPLGLTFGIHYFGNKMISL